MWNKGQKCRIQAELMLKIINKYMKGLACLVGEKERAVSDQDEVQPPEIIWSPRENE